MSSLPPVLDTPSSEIWPDDPPENQEESLSQHLPFYTLDNIVEETQEEPFVADPSKAFFSALPTELKMEILDWLNRWRLPRPNESRYDHVIILDPVCSRALKNMRLCNREFATLAARPLFATLRFKSGNDWYDRIDRLLLKGVAPYIRYVVLYAAVLRTVSPISYDHLISVDEEETQRESDTSKKKKAKDKYLSEILEKLPAVSWVAFDALAYEEFPLCMEVLRKYSTVTTMSLMHETSSESRNVYEGMLIAHGHRLKRLDISLDISPPNALWIDIRNYVTSLQEFRVNRSIQPTLGTLLVDSPFWSSRQTISRMHFVSCTALEADVVAKMIPLYPLLSRLCILSCGGPGTYHNAEIDAIEKERARVARELKPIKHKPLHTLRIRHATDLEILYMSPIPTERLIIGDPLDQMLLGPLLERGQSFPGLKTVVLQDIWDENNDGLAVAALRKACQVRNCQFKDNCRN